MIHFPQAVFLPESVKPSRKRWSIPEGVVTFLCSFDPGSDIERKNPRAGIEAFSRAFGDSEDTLLIVRVHSWSDAGPHAEAADSLERIVSGRRNIRLMRDKLTYEEVLSLAATCDVTVSTHRSEGLGLPLMEAMSLGRVALATGWSGNLDFMTPDNSLLIDSRLVPVVPSHPAYESEVSRPGQVWAEADVEHTARLMALVASDSSLRERLGANARADMARARARAESGATFDELERVLSADAASHSGRVRRLQRTLSSYRRDRYVQAAKRRIVKAGRAFGLRPKPE